MKTNCLNTKFVLSTIKRMRYQDVQAPGALRYGERLTGTESFEAAYIREPWKKKNI